MQKNVNPRPVIRLLVIVIIFFLFALFAGLQALHLHGAGFSRAFLITLGISLFMFILQVQYFLFTTTYYINRGLASPSDFQNPLDIWLFALPIAVLMVLSYLWLRWHIVEVFYCTMIGLTGMLFGNGLGRGAKQWSLRKSMPFFFGVAMSTAFAVIMEGII